MGERWELSDDALIDDASCCAQFRPLCRDMVETDESLRECIKINVCKPLRQRIAELEADLQVMRMYFKPYEEARREGARKALEWAQKFFGYVEQGWAGVVPTLDEQINAALGGEVDGGD